MVSETILARLCRAAVCVIGTTLCLALASFAQQPAALPVPNACQSLSGPPPCRDSDGDGLCDSWELAKRLPGGTPLPNADPNRLDIYLHYDYMGWATVQYELSPTGELISVPLPACTVDADCTRNNFCHEGRCSHTHKPDPAAIQAVVDAFAARGVNLHVDPDPHEVPHAVVLTFSRPDDPGLGAKAACAGADVQAGVIESVFAVNFHDIKDRYFDPKKNAAYHYAIFAHFSTCFTSSGTIGNCSSCPADRATPTGLPIPGMNGLAELPGNDFMVTMGSFFEPVGAGTLTVFNVGGVFMHELGHNLGLHHAGDIPLAPGATDSNMPNYVSVMNKRYTQSGMIEADAVGSAVPKTCSADSECTFPNRCFPPGPSGRCRRIDYSAIALNTLDESSLDESAGVSPLASGITDIIRFNNPISPAARGAGAGPVDWDGNGAIDTLPLAIDLDGDGLNSTVQRGFADWDHGSCQTDADCLINQIRTILNSNTPTHENCVQNRCRALIYPFQCTQWGKKD